MDNMTSNSEEKAKIPLQENKKKGLCTVPYIFAYLLWKQKQVQFTTSQAQLDKQV